MNWKALVLGVAVLASAALAYGESFSQTPVYFACEPLCGVAPTPTPVFGANYYLNIENNLPTDYLIYAIVLLSVVLSLFAFYKNKKTKKDAENAIQEVEERENE